MSPTVPDLTGRTLASRYRLYGIIGEGGFGTVYEAVDERLDRPVAVKVIKPWWDDDAEWTARFEREAQLAASLSHPGIVQVHDTGRDGRAGLYMVCELVDGESLASGASRERLTPAGIAEVGSAVLEALQAAHDRGIVHRDIKPQNILLTRDDNVKITDFGVARLSGGMTHSSASATVVGTPVYMSPEEARGRHARPTADIYSVGVVLYELLSGHPPFEGESHVAIALKHIEQQPPPLSRSVPPALASTVQRALEKEPNDRFASAAEMADALRAATAHPPDAAARAKAASSAGTANLRGRSTAVLDSAGGSALTSSLDTFSDERRPWHRHAAIAVAALAVLGAVLGLVEPWNSGPAPSSNELAAQTAQEQDDSVVAQRTVPRLRGLRVRTAASRTRRRGLVPDVDRRSSHRVAKGHVIAQSPPPGTTVDVRTTVDITASTGAPPVVLPDLSDTDEHTAQERLAELGLLSTVEYEASPDPPGTVLRQSPSARASVPPGGTVELTVAASDQWRTVTEFNTSSEASSEIFRIRGSQWRITYTLTFDRCRFGGCFPPDLEIDAASLAGGYRAYTLKEGTHTTAVPLGPGRYSVSVMDYGDTDFQVSVTVEDYW